MPLTTVVIMVDGLDPEYLEACPTPVLRQFAEDGFIVEGIAMMPTVTNVNNVSLITGCYPQTHGITSNYWFNRQTGSELYMESGEFIETQTMFQRAEALGARSLVITAKDKLLRLLSNGATLAVSAEQPPAWVTQGTGQPPHIYSLEVNQWVVDAGRYILSQEHYDLVYLTTTDYAMHTYAPDEPESAKHLNLLDEAIGKLVDSLPQTQVLITADHGMSVKSRMVDLEKELYHRGILARAVPIIKDRYTMHHSNLGGCIYLYLESGDQESALDALNTIEGVDEALLGEAAAQRFNLMASRIGDIVVLGSPEVVFGDNEEVALPKNLRSHGSLHEQRVPIIGYGGSFNGYSFLENRDLGRYVLDHVLS